MTNTKSGFKAFSDKANTALVNAHANETTKPDQTPPTPTDKPEQGENKPK